MLRGRWFTTDCGRCELWVKCPVSGAASARPLPRWRPSPASLTWLPCSVLLARSRRQNSGPYQAPSVDSGFSSGELSQSGDIQILISNDTYKNFQMKNWKVETRFNRSRSQIQSWYHNNLLIYPSNKSTTREEQHGQILRGQKYHSFNLFSI